MKYYILIVIGAVLGYAICAFMTIAKVNPAPPRRCRDCTCGMLYDFDLAEDADELQKIISSINHVGWQLIAVTQDVGMCYTVFFGRPRR